MKALSIKSLKANQTRWLLNSWPPFWAAGIRVVEISDDWGYVKVRLRKYWFNRNYVNVHYGGSLFSMTDPFYMLMIMQKLGKAYIVWDKTAEIKFIKPGRKDVYAEFRVSDQQISDYKQQLLTQDKIEPEFEIEIIDIEDNLISKVVKKLHISTLLSR